jgi:hypothetical protein
MSAYDLTNVASVKAWLGLPSTPTPSDATLAGLVVAASRTIYAALSRTSLLPQNYIETIDLESDRVYLTNWPVQQVNSVILDGLAVPAALPASAPPSLGYLLQPGDVAPPGRPQALDIFGGPVDGRRAHLVLTASAPFGAWARDLGVVYAGSGAALHAVTGAPGAGQ